MYKLKTVNCKINETCISLLIKVVKSYVKSGGMEKS